MRWPDIEHAIRSHLVGHLDGRVVTVLPARLEEQLPITRILRGPGSDDGITDAPLLDVETFAADRDSMWKLAEDTRQLLLGMAGGLAGGILIDTVTTASGPTWVDYGNPAVQRVVASYRLGLRQASDEVAEFPFYGGGY